GDHFRFLNLNPNLNLTLQRIGLRLRLGLRLRGEPKNVKCTPATRLPHFRLAVGRGGVIP
ncbi:MAG: hypothetical protein ABSG04_08970, partial [Verrucomicrobiota bacterium]